MSEEKNKWVKGADAKNMASVIDKMQNGTATNEQKFIMDSLAKLFSGSDKATFENKFDDYFCDAQQFGSTVRKAKPEKLEKDLVREIAYRVN